MYSLVNGLKQGFRNLFRNRLFTLASIGTITACLFLFGLSYCMVLNFHSMFTEVESTVGVTVFFNEGTTEERILEIKSQIEQRDDIDHVNYTSADEAWNEYKEKVFPDDESGVLTNLESDNPLENSASLEVYLKDVSAQNDVISFIQSIDDVRSVNSSESVAESFTSLGRLLAYVSTAIIVILVAVAVFLISNTVRIGIAVRHEEISIMKYLGATDFFVRAPFLVEGLLIGFIGSIIPLGLLWFLYSKVVNFVSNEFTTLSTIINFMPGTEVFKTLIPFTLLIGLGIGFIGSWLTLIRRLHV